MRISDKIAGDCMDAITEITGKQFRKKDYLSIECAIADTITKELTKWLSYDVDLNAFVQP